MASAMEPEHKPSAFQLLPDEAKFHIIDFIDFLDQAPTIEEAVQNIQNTAWVNQDFSRLLNDQHLTKKFIDRLMEKFPEQTRKDRILAAIYLNTAGSRIWLDKNHPEWKEYAKNLAKKNLNLAMKILDNFLPIDNFNVSVILSALLNVPEIADYIKNYKYKDDWEITALMVAAKMGDITIVEKLLAAGAKTNMKSKEGLTALVYAASFGHTIIVEKLLAAGAQPDIKDEDGMTALICAAVHGRTIIVEMLLAAGADPNEKNINAQTALDYAWERGHTAVIKLLEERMKKTGYK